MSADSGTGPEWQKREALHPATFCHLFHDLVFVDRPISAWNYGFDQIDNATKFPPSITDEIELFGEA